jgi:hypothetical protein
MNPAASHAAYPVRNAVAAQPRPIRCVGPLATALVLLCVAGAGRPANAQPADALQRLAALHERLLEKTATALSIDDGFRALNELEDLELDLPKLPAKARAQALETEIMVALAVGDAARALARVAELRSAPRDPLVLQMLSYRCAVAAGDAKQARAALAAAAQNKAAHVNVAEVTQAGEALDRVGAQIPAELLARLTDAASGPRKAIVLDFWNTRKTPPEAAVQGLGALRADFETELAFELIGVSTDGPASAQKAREAAKQRGYQWKQHFDAEPAGAATKLLQPRDPPWLVLIDSRGFVRAVGSAADPAFTYAVRAAVTEARGDHEYVAPVTVKGERVGPPPAAGGGPVAKAGGKKDDARSWDQLPSNPDAAAKLNTARAFMKTGKRKDAKRLLEEIIRDYPGTREAHLAQELIEDIR